MPTEPINPKVLARIKRRQERMSAWVDEQAPYALADQRHTVPNTPERAYWHYGYAVALKDVLRLLEEPASTDRSADK